jgi:hypothetical protein
MPWDTERRNATCEVVEAGGRTTLALNNSLVNGSVGTLKVILWHADQLISDERKIISDRTALAK